MYTLKKDFQRLKKHHTFARYYVAKAGPNRKVTKGRLPPGSGKHGYTVEYNFAKRESQIQANVRFTHSVRLKLSDARALEALIKSQCKVRGLDRAKYGYEYYTNYKRLLFLVRRVCSELGLSLELETK